MENCPKCGAPNSVHRDACYNCGSTLQNEGALRGTHGAIEQSASKKARPRLAALVVILAVVCMVGTTVGCLYWLWSPRMEARRLAGTYELISAHLVPGVGADPGFVEFTLVPPTASGRMVITPDGTASQGVSTSYQTGEARAEGVPNSVMATGTITFYPREGLFKNGTWGLTGTYQRDGDLLTTVADVGAYRETDVWRRVQ